MWRDVTVVSIQEPMSDYRYLSASRVRLFMCSASTHSLTHLLQVDAAAEWRPSHTVYTLGKSSGVSKGRRHGRVWGAPRVIPGYCSGFQPPNLPAFAWRATGDISCNLGVFHEQAFYVEVARGNGNVHWRTSHTMMMMMMMRHGGIPPNLGS